MGRTSTLPKRLQPMLATLTDKPFDDDEWVFEDKYDGFRMVANIEGGRVTLYSRNGKIISDSYIEVAKALEGVNGDAVIDGELVALDENGVSHFQLLQNALRHKARLLYCAFDLMFQDGDDLRGFTLLERKKRLKSILPRHKLIEFSRHHKKSGTEFFEEAERKGLEGIMGKLMAEAETALQMAAGAGLDVFDAEPLPSGHPLTKLPNVVLTSNLGWPTDEMYSKFADAAADALLAYLDGRDVPRFVAHH
jgi:ATP-dependent DNA ligase